LTGSGCSGLNFPYPKSSLASIRRQAIAFLAEPISPKSVYCGVEILPNDIIVNRSDVIHCVIHWRCDANHRSGSMSLPKHELHSVFKAVTGHDFREKNDVRLVRPDPALMPQRLNLHKAIGQLADDVPDLLEIPEVGRGLEQKLIHLMVRCLNGDDLHVSLSRLGHDATMIKFEEFLEANCDRPLYLSEVCVALDVAERTLRSCCEDHLGMGPIRYLTMRRMHLVHRTLRRAERSQTTVTRAATDHGFWELGRFSVAYPCAIRGVSIRDTAQAGGAS
jgi:AraC-like DNA-binding protein